MTAAKRPSTFGEVLASHARSRANEPAILCPGRPPLAYEALAEEIHGIGLRLAQLGLGRGSRIAVALPHGPECAVAIVAIAEWASCVPLNPALDVGSARALLEDRRVGAIVIGSDTPPAMRRAAESLGIAVVLLEPRDGEAAGASTIRGMRAAAPLPATPAREKDEALVLHTSGTTTRPKAVSLSQTDVLARSSVYGIDADDRCLCIAPLFTGSALGHSLFAPLFVGGSVVVPADLSPGSIVDCIARLRPTYYSASPTVHTAILGELRHRPGRCQHSLRFVRASSSPLPTALQLQLEAALDVPVIQGYGMTESGTIAQNPLPPQRRKAGAVGVSLGLEVAIVDDSLSALPTGSVGQVVVRGSGVCSRYEGDEPATRTAFVDGWFRTGDLGYLDEDGYLFLTGRLKDLVNRGGLKVSPAEVDAAMLRHPDVEDVATFPLPHRTLGEDVATAVVLREASTATAQELREFALANLASYKVPSSITVLASLPKNPSGKISRREVARLVAELPSAPFCAARSPTEEIVVDAFAAALGPCESHPGIHDNFFRLGGDSLRGLLVLSRVNAALGINLQPDSLFTHPTAADLARAAEIACRSAAGRTLPPLVARRKHR